MFSNWLTSKEKEAKKRHIVIRGSRRKAHMLCGLNLVAHSQYAIALQSAHKKTPLRLARRSGAINVFGSFADLLLRAFN